MPKDILDSGFVQLEQQRAVNHDFSSYLREGEELLWQGQPDARFYLDSSDIVNVPFSLAWTGVPLYLTFQFINES